MSIEVTLYADTFDDVKLALQNELRRRAASLRNAGRTKTDKAMNERAAYELESEADWLTRTQFKPRSENPFKKT